MRKLNAIFFTLSPPPAPRALGIRGPSSAGGALQAGRIARATRNVSSLLPASPRTPDRLARA